MRLRFALLLCLFGLFSTSALIQTQSAHAAPIFKRTTMMPARATQTRGSALLAPVAVDRTALQAFRQARGGRLALPMPDGSSAELELRPFELFTEGATITQTGALGPKPIALDLSVFRGEVVGEPGSWAVVSMSGEQVMGSVVRAGGRRFAIAPAVNTVGDHFVRDEADLPAREQTFSCGADELPSLMPPGGARSLQQNAAEPNWLRLQCDVAVECDYDYYNGKFGGNLVNATNYITTLMATVSAIYERDLNVQLKVPYLNIWTTGADPYNTGNLLDRLTEFENYWNANRTGVARRIAHHVSGYTLGGGIANLGVLCNKAKGYGVSQVDATYSYPNNSTTWDVHVIAHEIGHNFFSFHTHDCAWQALGYAPPGALLDSCATTHSNTCNPTLGGILPPDKGTIMGYCAQLGPIANTDRLDFHTATLPWIRRHAEACLQILQPPAAVTVTPVASGANITWKGSTSIGVPSYDVYRSAFQLDVNPTLLGNTTDSTWFDSSPGTWYYKLKSVRFYDQSEYSGEVKGLVCFPSPPAGTNAGSQPYSVAQGDFNEDGIADLVVPNFGGDNVSVLIGQGAGGVGNGTFAPAVNYAMPGGTNPSCAVAGDWNEDGILDLAVGTWVGNFVQLLMGQGTGGVGNGTFTSGITLPTASFPYFIQTADLDENGILDLVVVHQSGSLSVLLGQGTGGVGNATFASPASYSAGISPRQVVIRDFNEDGILDLAVAHSTGANVLLGQGTGGDGDGTFAAPVSYAGGTGGNGIASGDWNDDGILDLALSNQTSQNVSVFLGQGAAGVGNGTFAAAVNYAAGASPMGIGVCDWSQDGIEDLVVCNNSSSSLSILTGKGAAGVGNGTFATAQPFPAQTAPRFLLVGDYNGNGVGDVVVVNADVSGRISVLTAGCLAPLASTIVVTSPNGGESWIGGTEHVITWTNGAGVTAVNLELSRNGGVDWEPIASGVIGTSFPWTATDPYTTTARLRVTDATSTTHRDASDANFTVVPASMVDVPSGPTPLALRGVFPNPAVSELNVAFSLPAPEAARLELIDLAGRRVRAMDVGGFGPGAHVVTLARGERLAPGVYLVRLTQGGRTAATKAVFMR